METSINLVNDQNISTELENELISFDELQSALKEKQLQYDVVNQSNLNLSECKKSLEDQVLILQKALEEKEEEFKALEEDRTFLRKNIKKASAHWFERKAKLSESDSEILNDSISRQNSDGSDSNKEIHTNNTNLVYNNDACIQVNLLSDAKAQDSFTCKPEDFAILTAELGYKTEQLELSEKKCSDLNKRLKEYENIIDDQEFIIHGMKDQLDTYFEDNQKMSKKLIDLNKLFQELELIDNTNVNNVNPPDTGANPISVLPSEKDFKDMAGSVSKTYVKLKDLIYEKKSLVTEIERLQTLNVELQRRVVQQESRLFSVSDAIHKTWLLVSDLKEQHAKIHTAESVLRYELKEKREILHKLREELESSREQWVLIREKNSESEKEWKSIQDELKERRRLAAENKDGQESLSDILKGGAGNNTPSEYTFEPPVDLLMDMGIEYGCIDPDDDTSTTVIAAVEGEDVHGERLQDLEDQCSYLYQKLMSSTARSLALASRLSSLHQHYGDMSDDDDDDDTEDENDDDYNEDETDANFFESDMASPDSDSYDTAYVSEPDVAESGSTSGIHGTLSEDDASPTGLPKTLDTLPEGIEDIENSVEIEEDSCDVLSRRLINFLPKKIEILRAENKKLEDKYAALHEEKHKLETNLTLSLDSERLIRRQLEESMRHLGKCVDELKLERNGKIAEVEKELRKKVERLDQQEATAEELQEQLDELKEKFDERGNLLQITNDQLNQKEATIQQLKRAMGKMDDTAEIEDMEQTVSDCGKNLRRTTLLSTGDLLTSLQEFLRSTSCTSDIRSEVQSILSTEELLKDNEEDCQPDLSVRPKSTTTSANQELEDDITLEEEEEERVVATDRVDPESVKSLTLCTSLQLRQSEYHQEIWLNPCDSTALPIQLNSGDALSWSIQAYPKLTWLTLIQHPNATCTQIEDSVDAKLVMKRTKLTTDVSPVHGTLLAKLAGIYTFLFDNRTARYTSRKVVCKFWLKEESDKSKFDEPILCVTPDQEFNLEHDERNSISSQSASALIEDSFQTVSRVSDNLTEATAIVTENLEQVVSNVLNSGSEVNPTSSENCAETDDRPDVDDANTTDGT